MMPQHSDTRAKLGTPQLSPVLKMHIARDSSAQGIIKGESLSAHAQRHPTLCDGIFENPKGGTANFVDKTWGLIQPSVT